ncbi:MAG: hypothetical protein R3242_07140 [Akkermansiaceae bacterium]|nr:hypothetical protein [Akkermansiaceae bacterium]
MALLTSALQADTASFSGDHGQLSGTLEAIGKDGVILWSSPYSKDPLKLRADKVDQIQLDSSQTAKKTHPIQLTLENGDVLPASGIRTLDGEALLAETPVAGMVRVPRPALASAQFGISERKVIYMGFDNLGLWTRGVGEPENWRLRGSTLISSGPSIAARDFELPRNFTLSFSLAWEDISPDYHITFADPLVKASKQEDFYRFDFDRSGIRISRQIGVQGRLRTLAQWQRHPKEFVDKQIDVRIEVNREQRELELFINGESEGVIKDPIDSIPDASGFSFHCQTGSGGKQMIGDLEITELNDSRTRHLAEKRGDPALDCLITTDDDRWTGELLSMAASPDEAVVIFQTSFSKEAWEIPESEISTLFFAEQTVIAVDDSEPTYLLKFHGKGKLSVSNCVISEGQVSAIHPLLGELAIDRKAIRAIRRIAK